MEKVKIGGKPVTLREGETVIWQGRPVPGILRNPVHIGFGALLMALGLWLIIGGYDPLAAAGAMLGLPFVGIGAYLAYFNAIVEKNRRAATYYALTNQRAILAYSLRVLAYPILPEFRIELKKGRYDTVFFALDRQLGVQQGSSRRRVGFGHLENGDEVFGLMKSIQKNGQPTP